MIGTNDKEMKNRREITAEFLFFELSAVGFLGLASMLFKEKQMGVIRVHGVLPIRRSMFILSKLLLLLLSDLAFTVLLTVSNLGTLPAMDVLPGSSSASRYFIADLWHWLAFFVQSGCRTSNSFLCFILSLRFL